MPPRLLLPDLPKRRVLAVSDRYPPDTAGGAELSLHLLLREPVLRDQVLVATFDKAASAPVLREIDGVAVLALPAPAAWPLHSLAQAEVDALKRRPMGLKWPAFLRVALRHLARAPSRRLPAFALRLAGAPPGGVAMDHDLWDESAGPAALRQVIAAVRPALVHADNARAILAASEALKDGGPPMLALVRDHRFASARFDQTFGGDEPGGWRARLADRFARDALAWRQDRLRSAALAVVTSRALEERLHGRVAEETLRRAALIPVIPGDDGPPPADGRVRLLVVGALNANKGQRHLMEGFGALLETIPNVEIGFAGDGPDRAALAGLARPFGDRVRLHGRVDHAALGRLYRDADIVVAPALWEEPFGRTPLEAAAHGRPTVAYASGGLAETIVDGVTGRLVRPGDRDALIGAIAELAADRVLRERMGAAARDRAARLHAPATLARQLAGLWDQAAAAGNVAPGPGGG